MDRIDREIVRVLQTEGRITNHELAERVGLTPSPCLRRVRHLEESGVITGYAARISPREFGLNVTAFVRVTLHRQTEESVREFERAIQDIDEIRSCYMMAGDGDYLLTVYAADLAGYEQFLRRRMHRIPGITSISTSFAIGEVKSACVFPQPR